MFSDFDLGIDSSLALWYNTVPRGTINFYGNVILRNKHYISLGGTINFIGRMVIGQNNFN